MMKWESYISGPRTRLPAGIIRKNLLDFNSEVGTNLTLVYEVRETSLFKATIFFEIKGSELDLLLFQEAFYSAAIGA